MRFDLPESITAMRAGHKTQTRRRSPYWLQKNPGDRITIVHRGEYLGHATVVRTWQQEGRDMTEAEARAEGYDSLWGFWRAWGSIHARTTDELVKPLIAIEFRDIKWRNGGEDATA